MKPRYLFLMTMVFTSVVLTAEIALAAPPVPKVEEPASTAPPPRPDEAEADHPPRNYVNLRVGGSSGSQGFVLCAEVAPLSMLSVEACGNGSGVLHNEFTPEIAHFRANLRITSLKMDMGWLEPRVSAGFAEMQVGADSAGFSFAGVGPTGSDTAGPELGASLRALFPVYGGVEIVGDFSVSAAYFHYADELARPQSSVQPSVALSLGVGF
jgi:hypothetical protein